MTDVTIKGEVNKRISIDIPKDIFKKIEAAAKKERRTVKAQIEMIVITSEQAKKK